MSGLDAGADPDRILGSYRDSWLMNRHTVQPGTAFSSRPWVGLIVVEAMKDATSIDDVFIRLEQAGFLLR